jgi:integrase
MIKLCHALRIGCADCKFVQIAILRPRFLRLIGIDFIQLAGLLGKVKDIASDGSGAVSPHDLRRTFVTTGFSACGIDLFKLELLTNHVPQGITARHYLQTSRLQYLHPEVQSICDWIEEQARIAYAKATGANVVPLRA